jgi:hypothetical protein
MSLALLWFFTSSPKEKAIYFVTALQRQNVVITKEATDLKAESF